MRSKDRRETREEVIAIVQERDGRLWPSVVGMAEVKSVFVLIIFHHM